MHRGENLLACRIQPWHSSAPISRAAAVIVLNKAIIGMVIPLWDSKMGNMLGGTASLYEGVLQTTPWQGESDHYPDNDERQHARRQQPSLLRWDQPLMKCIQECYEAFGNMVIGEGSTQCYVGAPLSWNCGPVPNEVPSRTPHFTEIETGFININEEVMCPPASSSIIL